MPVTIRSGSGRGKQSPNVNTVVPQHLPFTQTVVHSESPPLDDVVYTTSVVCYYQLNGRPTADDIILWRTSTLIGKEEKNFG